MRSLVSSTSPSSNFASRLGERHEENAANYLVFGRCLCGYVGDRGLLERKPRPCSLNPFGKRRPPSRRLCSRPSWGTCEDGDEMLSLSAVIMLVVALADLADADSHALWEGMQENLDRSCLTTHAWGIGKRLYLRRLGCRVSGWESRRVSWAWRAGPPSDVWRRPYERYCHSV